MVQQTIDSKFSEYGMGATESELPVHDKQLSVPVKKTALRDLQNHIKVAMPHSIGNSSQLKDGGPISNAPRVSGTKRPLPEPECPMSPPQHQLPSSSAANGHLVYVRRKSEADVVRSSTCDNASINADCQVSRMLSHHEASIRPSHHEASTRPIFQTKEPKVYCIPAFAPFPMSASTIQPGKPSVSAPHCKSGIRIAPSGSNPLASATQTLAVSKGLRNLHWEERCHQLQLLLRKLDQSEQENYLQMLQSLSSVDLSRHAVELEKRSIQLSLEEGYFVGSNLVFGYSLFQQHYAGLIKESLYGDDLNNHQSISFDAKELQRVGFLNVLGKPTKQFKVPSTHLDRSDK